jgi:chloramphenicol-sensitive protein RarD
MSDARAATVATAAHGLPFALIAYGLWGLFPIYWKQLSHVSAAVVLCHRVLWSVVFTLGVLALRGGLAGLVQLMRQRALRRALFVSTSLIAVNWGLFIWAVSVDRVTEASLGYYINPLLNVALARVVLGERLTRLQAAAVGLAAIAVVYLTVSMGALPWVSLVLALTFSLYGLVRKQAPVGALEGLTIETGLAAPAALIALLWLDPGQSALTTADVRTAAFLIGSGVATALPLLAFAAAARRLRYSTLGIVQYLAPSLQLVCAVLLYGEPFRRVHALTFGLIWVAVVLYSFEALRTRARLPKAVDAGGGG